MPTVSFSQDFIQSSLTSNNAMGRVMNYSSVSGLLARGGLFGGGNFSQILIMKGTIPSTLTSSSFASRSADVLCTFAIQINAIDDFTPSASTYFLNPAVTTSIYKAATASGTATWFWWITRLDNTPDTLGQQIAGTVGVTGSGSDLEISSTTITSGQLLRISNLRMRLPITYTY